MYGETRIGVFLFVFKDIHKSNITSITRVGEDSSGVFFFVFFITFIGIFKLSLNFHNHVRAKQ